MHNIRSFLGKKSLFVFLELVGLVCLLSIAGHVAVTLHEDSTTKIQAKKVVWSLGEADGTADEFAGQDQLVQTVTIPSGVTLKETTRKVPSGLNKLSNSELSIAYRLDSIPKYGVMLRVKILDAYKAIPQMAVFSNQQLSGIVQIAGVDGTESKYPFIKTYSLYIPKEQLQIGNNDLRLAAIRCLYCSSDEDPYLSWTWDYLSLETLSTPAAEPIHGNEILTGTTVNNEQFYYDEAAVRHLPYVMKWLGIAYSGNIMRTGCASDVGGSCSSISEYYEVLKDYNMQAISYHLHTGNLETEEDGTLPENAEQTLRAYMEKYGSLFQYYEVDNEPGLFNRSKAINIAIAKWLKKNRAELAPQLKTVAPGWAYWPGFDENECRNQQEGGPKQCGDPDGWERDPLQRLELEKLTDMTNGHSYGESYVDNEGGSFVENLQTFGGALDGLPKKMINTEFGTSDDHLDNQKYGASEPKSAAFDRIMRAHIGYADMFIQHAAFFEDYSLFQTGFNLEGHNPAKTQIYYNEGNNDSRVGIMRRLSLAYATHGKPLEYSILNKDDNADKLVYFRAVDTSTLDPLPVTGATSDKLLLNFVNFESTPQKLSVRIKLPKKTIYEGERFGAGDTYEQSRSYVNSLKADPYIEITETLEPGAAVQYILAPAKSVALKAPSWITAVTEAGPSVQIDWLEAEGAWTYDVLRVNGANGIFQEIAESLDSTHYVDRTVKNGERYSYAIRLSGSNEVSAATDISSGLFPLDRKRFVISGTNSVKSDPRKSIDSSIRTRWDTGVWQVPGQFFQIDLGEPTTIEQIRLDTSRSSYDYPRAYEIYVSDDGKEWGSAILKGKGTKNVTDIRFPAVTTRFVKIVNTGSVGNYWSIHDLQIYSRG